MLNIKSIVKNTEKKFYVDVMFENDLNVYTRKTYKEKEFDGRIYSFVFSGVKVFFDLTTMNVIDQKVIYETKGIKKTSTYIGSKRIKEVKPLEKKTVNVENNNEEVKHEKYDQIKTCLECNIPIYLAGPAGSGKNFTVKNDTHKLGGTTEERLTYVPHYMQEYYDTDLNKKLIYNGVNWVDYNGNVIS